MLSMPILETTRLKIRPFEMNDLEAIYQILDVELGFTHAGSRAERERWLRWTVMNYDQLAKLYQPPYGDRAVVLGDTGRLIGAVGFVPCLNLFARLRSLRSGALIGASEINGREASGHSDDVPADFTQTEFGLFYAFSPAYQRQGYATEAVKAMVAYAFTELRLGRIVATTTYDNERSIAVMRRLGMRIEKNPQPEPPWLQIVGILGNGADSGPVAAARW